MENMKLVLSPLVLLLLVSCVTINVYFPAAAAQEAAKEIVDEVLKQTQSLDTIPLEKEPQSNEKLNPQSSLPPINSDGFMLTEKVLIPILDFIVPVAYAAVNMAIDSPKIRSIRNQLKKHHSRLAVYFNQGNIGHADNGLIKIRNSNGLNIKQKSMMKKLLNTANATLLNLYREIANANGRPDWKVEIQKTFAKTWLKEIQPGWMYFSAGQWKKK